MYSALDDGDGAVVLLPPAPPPPALPPVPPAPVVPPVAPPPQPPQAAQGAGGPVNAYGETLAQAEAAVLAEVAAGSLGADALARHPLPPGTSTAEVLRFLASLPQTSYATDSSGGVVTGPPIGAGGGGAAAGGPPAGAAGAVNVNGETLEQAEAAVLLLVSQGMLGALALALHPLPPGTSTAEALRFLSTLPQTSYAPDSSGGVVTGPPVGESTDASGVLGAERELESAYKPPGVQAQWRNLVDVFKTNLPAKRHAVDLASKSLLQVFK